MDFLNLVYVLTLAQLKSRYRKTVAGFLWVLMNPILTFVIQSLLFKSILKIEMDKYYTFLLSGIIPWIFIATSWNMCVNIFVSQRSIFLAFKIHPLIMILVQVFDNLINYFASYLILFLVVDWQTFLNPLTLFLFCLYSVGLLAFVILTSFAISLLNVYFRDTQFVVQFFLNLAYFITPIFYPFHLLPQSLKKIVLINPIYYMVKPFQELFWKKDYTESLYSISIVLILNLTIFFIVNFFWRRKRDELFNKV